MFHYLDILLNKGIVRTPNENLLPHTRSCYGKLNLESTLFLAIPLISPIVGLGRLRDVLYNSPSSKDVKESTLRFTYFITTSVIAMLGFGFIISALRIIIMIIKRTLWGLASIISLATKCCSTPSIENAPENILNFFEGEQT